MINYETILSTFDDKLTLLQWLQKVEQALQGAGLERVDITQVTPTTAVFKFTFADGTSLTTPSITLPRGPKGDTGATGATGNGIASITKTGTSGLIDTYTVLYTNGTTDTFTVTNGADGAEGNGIASIAKTSTVGLVDTYTVTYTDGDTMTYTVTNGADGTMEVIDIGTATGTSQSFSITEAQYNKLTADAVTCLIKVTYNGIPYILQREYVNGIYTYYGGILYDKSHGYNKVDVAVYQYGTGWEAFFTIANAIEINPTLAGTESAVTGIQIGTTKFKVEGGSQLYQHNICVVRVGQATGFNIQACFILISKSSTAITKTNIITTLNNLGYNNYDKYILATGIIYDNTDAKQYVIFNARNYNGLGFNCMASDNTQLYATTKTINTGDSALTISDTVITL